MQSSLYNEAVTYIDGLESKRNFLRTPNQYGYATLSFFPNKNLNASLNMVYTGTMEIAHFAGAPEQDADEFVVSDAFVEWSFKASYTFGLKTLDSGLELLEVSKI